MNVANVFMLMLVWLTDLLVGRRLGRAGYLANIENMAREVNSLQRVGRSVSILTVICLGLFNPLAMLQLNPRDTPPGLHSI